MQSVKMPVMTSSAKMTLLGAGGAATAILVQAALDGLKEISVFVRPTSRFYDRLVHTVDELTKITDCKIKIFAIFPTLNS